MNTPGYNIRLAIRFTADKHGNKLAHYWSRAAMRWFRLPLADAEIFIATEAADKIAA